VTQGDRGAKSDFTDFTDQPFPSEADRGAPCAMIARSNGIGMRWTENGIYASMADNWPSVGASELLKGSPTDF
jgi:hypothetical protein